MEIKIKNITVNVDGQDFSFTAKSLVAEQAYDPKVDPEVQGKSLEDLQHGGGGNTIIVPAEEPATPVEVPVEVPVAEPVVEAPVEATNGAVEQTNG